MHQKLQFYHLTHFYFSYSSQSSLRNITKALYRCTTIRIHYDVINIVNSAKKFRESYLRAFLNDCIQITILDYLFLLRFLSIFFFSFIGLLLSHQNLLRLIQYFCTTLYPLTLKGFLTPLFSWLNVSLLSFWDSHSYLLHAFYHHHYSRPLFDYYQLFLLICQIQFLNAFPIVIFN